MGKKSGVGRVVESATKAGSKVAKGGRGMLPTKGKSSIGKKISGALPGGGGAIAGLAGSFAVNKAIKFVENKLEERSNDSENGEASEQKAGATPKLRDIIQEYIDISAPRDFTFESWTSYEDLAGVFKGVRWVKEEGSDRTKWVAKIGPVTREWEAEADEAKPSKIGWESKGGTRNVGVVAFHELGENLTRIMVEMEYRPDGPVEGVGQFLRIPRRRVRRDLKLFKHHVELNAKDRSSARSSKRSNGSNGSSGRSRYEDRPMEELVKKAAEMGIEGRSSMTKSELIKALRER